MLIAHVVIPALPYHRVWVKLIITLPLRRVALTAAAFANL